MGVDKEDTESLAGDWMRLGAVVWQATFAARRAVHVASSGRPCPSRTAPLGVVTEQGVGWYVDCENAGCLDLFHDVMLATRHRLEKTVWPVDQQGPLEPERYIYVVATRTIADLKRSHRARLGFAARPGRSDGPAGRVIAAIRERRPTEADWLIAVFRMTRDYANKLNRTSVEWPVDGWVQEKCHYDGRTREISSLTRHEIRADITMVLGVAAEVLGREWVSMQILRPLYCTAAAAPLEEADAPALTDYTNLVLSRAIRATYSAARRHGATAADAYRAAAGSVARVADPPLTSEVQMLLRVMDDELAVSR